jgi:hypothetical protein
MEAGAESCEVVVIRKVGDGSVVDYFAVDTGATGLETFEYYAADARFARCRRDQAKGEAVLVSVPRPSRAAGTTPASFHREVAAAALEAKVSFGFVRRAELGAA